MSQLATSGNIKNLLNITVWEFYYKIHVFTKQMPSILQKKNSCASIANKVATKNVVFCQNKEEQGLKFYIQRAYSTFTE